jgi:hypothetical protein
MPGLRWKKKAITLCVMVLFKNQRNDAPAHHLSDFLSVPLLTRLPRANLVMHATQARVVEHNN